MNILISTGHLNYAHDANTKIVAQVAQKLCDLGNEVTIIGECLTPFDITKPKCEGKVQFHRLFSSPYVQKASLKLENYVNKEKFKGNRNYAKKLFMLTHPIDSAFLAYRYSKFFTHEKRMAKYAQKVLEFSKKIKPDCLICVYSPFAYTKPIFDIEAQFGCTLQIWQLDPWGLHRLPEIDPDLTNDDRKMQELAVFEKANHIFTTSILIKQYSQNESYAKFINKCSVLQFPNITADNSKLKGKCVCDFENEYINLLFCGAVSDVYRSPEYLLKNLEILIKNNVKIKVFFLGGKDSKILDNYLEKYPKTIKSYSSVPLADAFATMENADVLINIGNTFDNQVPSKIFDYFAMGKPVLNVQKIANCPSKEFFDRYKLGFTLDETRQTEDLDALQSFIENSKGKKEDFDKVAKTFFDCTPEFVAQKIASTI